MSHIGCLVDRTETQRHRNRRAEGTMSDVREVGEGRRLTKYKRDAFANAFIQGTGLCTHLRHKQVIARDMDNMGLLGEVLRPPVRTPPRSEIRLISPFVVVALRNLTYLPLSLSLTYISMLWPLSVRPRPSHGDKVAYNDAHERNMTTPSSSTTTPSPQMRYMQANPVVLPQSPLSTSADQNDREERERVAQKFLARAELSKGGRRPALTNQLPDLASFPSSATHRTTMVRSVQGTVCGPYRARPCMVCLMHVAIFPLTVHHSLTYGRLARKGEMTHALRTTLSYATFKATNNLSQNNIFDLEAKTDVQPTLYRQSPGRGNNYYNNPATQGNSAMVANNSSRNASRKGAMAPPPVTASARQSLYASILAPPPTKRARTIHNPEDPPVPAPQRPKPLSAKGTSKATRTTPSSSKKQSKSKKDDKGKRRESGGSAGKPLSRTSSFSTQDGSIDEDMDLKAAATLTSLLRSRPSISAATSSPRSSISAASEPSQYNYSHFAQSSTRTTTAPPSREHSFTMPYSSTRSSTPTSASSMVKDSDMRYRGSATTPKAQGRPVMRRPGDPTTPHPPSDTEAADLMLYLATSPSPVRPTTTRDKDPSNGSLYRSLSGDSALQGRVLFPGSEDGAGRGPRPLRRELTGSFGSTVTNVTEAASSDTTHGGSQDSIMTSPARSPPLSSVRSGDSQASPGDDRMSVDVPHTAVIPPTPTDESPASVFPASNHRTSTLRATGSLPSSTVTPDSKSAFRQAMMTTPTPSGFSLSEFLNVSPSPAVTAPGSRLSAIKKAEVGRRLFEEHHGGASGDRSERGSTLSSGADLHKS
ncbi:hypothetical protein K474DRAFT_1679025 [Panus rudis PR-1116 ss-1]|nr:hypothetical protein K474DRAFT_1679025 [Panus rudis PR-1116 ss-1]